jgi:hypothetical protein
VIHLVTYSGANKRFLFRCLRIFSEISRQSFQSSRSAFTPCSPYSNSPSFLGCSSHSILKSSHQDFRTSPPLGATTIGEPKLVCQQRLVQNKTSYWFKSWTPFHLRDSTDRCLKVSLPRDMPNEGTAGAHSLVSMEGTP